MSAPGKNWYLRKIMAGLIVGLGLTGICQCAELAPVKIPRCAQAPNMDGSLTDECWKNAAVLKDFTVIGKGVTTDSTECRLTLDDTWLYFGFRCKNPGMAQMDQKVTERDVGVGPDDSLEVYFDPGSDGALFFQFMLSYANVQADRMFTRKDGRDAFWDLPWRSATKVEKDGWTAEMAIPLFLIDSYGDPAKVRLNVARNERRIILDQTGAKLKEEKEGICWSPVLKSYSEPDKFRAISGFEGIKIGVPEMIAMEGAEVGGYEMIGDKRDYTVKVRLRSYTGKGGKALIEVRDCPQPDGKGAVVAQEVAVKPMELEEFIIRVPVTSLRQRNTVVALKETGGGTLCVLREITIKEPAVLNLMGAAFTDRNYYTTEKEARLRVRIGLPEAELKDKTLIVKLADGKVLGKARGTVQDMEIAFPLKKIPVGEHTLTVALEDSKGAVVLEGQTVLTKLTPKPGCEVKTDRFNRVVLKNGVPYFPFGLVKSRLADSDLKEVSDAGHNAILRWEIPSSSLKQFMETAQKHGLDVVDFTFWNHVIPCVRAESPTKQWDDGALNTMPRDAAHAKELMESLERGLEKARQPTIDDIRVIRDFPNLIGYYNMDEPNLVNVAARMGAARALYKWIHQEDGYRPVFSLMAGIKMPLRIPAGITDLGDVLMFDTYINPGWNRFDSRPNYMTSQMLLLKRLADGAHKPAMMVPLAESLDPNRTPRVLTADEQRCQTYLAVIHEAKGLFYFVDSGLRTQGMWDTLAELARQMKVIGPAAVSGEVYPAVKYTPGAIDIVRDQYPDVQATLFKNPAGGYLLLAANTALYPVDVTYTVPGIKASKGVQRLFKDGDFKVEGNGFKDKIEPYGVRAYALELEAKPEKPVQLALEMVGHPDQAMPFKYFEAEIAACRKRKNVMPNPLFEIMTMPGVPDYILPGSYELDPVNPCKGKHSLRMQSMISGIFYLPELEKPTSYVLSMYLRGGKNDDMVVFHVPAMEGAPSVRKKAPAFRVTTEWKRYWISGVFPKGVGVTVFSLAPCLSYFENGSFRAVPNYTNGFPVIWMDGMQVEAGTEPTEFTTE